MWTWLTTLFFNPITTLLRRIIVNQEVLMGNLDELKTALAKLSATVDAERTEVSTKVQALTDQIRALQEQLASGGYETLCDPRLNVDQALELAFRLAQALELLTEPAS